MNKEQLSDIIKSFDLQGKKTVSANQNYAKAQTMLSVYYHEGVGTKKDYKRAFEWAKKAAEQNVPDAQVYLGFLYKDGDGVRQNLPIAKEWFGKACDNGNQFGCEEYAKLNTQGY